MLQTNFFEALLYNEIKQEDDYLYVALQWLEEERCGQRKEPADYETKGASELLKMPLSL